MTGKTVVITWGHPTLGCMCSTGRLVGEHADGYLITRDIVPGDGESFAWPVGEVLFIPKPVTEFSVYEKVVEPEIPQQSEEELRTRKVPFLSAQTG